MKYNAFISYSHAADEKLASAVQACLKKFAKPWNKLRALEIFRDKTDLSVNPDLWKSIEEALRESDFFILMASPESAHSDWVKQEVETWLNNDPRLEKILIILTGGDLQWNKEKKNFCWREESPLPENLRNRFSKEPLWLDLRWSKSENQSLSLRNPKFNDGIAQLAATLHRKSLKVMVGEDVRQYKKTMRLKRGAIFSLAALLIVALGLAYWANESRKIAAENRKKAEEQTKIAQRGAYNAQVARASDLWKRDPDLALRILNDTGRVPKDLRDFSWGVLYRASKKTRWP